MVVFTDADKRELTTRAHTHTDICSVLRGLNERGESSGATELDRGQQQQQREAEEEEEESLEPRLVAAAAAAASPGSPCGLEGCYPLRFSCGCGT